MVEITIYKTNKQGYSGFDAKGHAGLAESGQDILCSAISMLVINTINSIERFTADAMTIAQEETDGIIEVRFLDEVSKDSELLLDSMMLGLSSLEENESYQPFIDIIYKEV